MVPFWVLSVIRPLVCRDPKEDHNFDKHPSMTYFESTRNLPNIDPFEAPFKGAQYCTGAPLILISTQLGTPPDV